MAKQDLRPLWLTGEQRIRVAFVDRLDGDPISQEHLGQLALDGSTLLLVVESGRGGAAKSVQEPKEAVGLLLVLATRRTVVSDEVVPRLRQRAVVPDDGRIVARLSQVDGDLFAVDVRHNHRSAARSEHLVEGTRRDRNRPAFRHAIVLCADEGHGDRRVEHHAESVGLQRLSELRSLDAGQAHEELGLRESACKRVCRCNLDQLLQGFCRQRRLQLTFEEIADLSRAFVGVTLHLRGRREVGRYSRGRRRAHQNAKVFDDALGERLRALVKVVGALGKRAFELFLAVCDERHALQRREGKGPLRTVREGVARRDERTVSRDELLVCEVSHRSFDERLRLCEAENVARLCGEGLLVAFAISVEHRGGGRLGDGPAKFAGGLVKEREGEQRFVMSAEALGLLRAPLGDLATEKLEDGPLFERLRGNRSGVEIPHRDVVGGTKILGDLLELHRRGGLRAEEEKRARVGGSLGRKGLAECHELADVALELGDPIRFAREHLYGATLKGFFGQHHPRVHAAVPRSVGVRDRPAEVLPQKSHGESLEARRPHLLHEPRPFVEVHRSVLPAAGGLEQSSDTCTNALGSRDLRAFSRLQALHAGVFGLRVLATVVGWRKSRRFVGSSRKTNWAAARSSVSTRTSAFAARSRARFLASASTGSLRVSRRSWSSRARAAGAGVPLRALARSGPSSGWASMSSAQSVMS